MPKPDIEAYVWILGLVIVLSCTYNYLTDPLYREMIKNIQHGHEAEPRSLFWDGIIIVVTWVWFCFLILPSISAESSDGTVLGIAALNGITVYGTWNASNFTMFQNLSPAWIALMDTIWGTVFTTVTIVSTHKMFY